MITLKQITAPILDDIKIFQSEFEEALRSEVRLINTITKYIVKNKGKHIRPILTILSSRICGEPTGNSYRAAAMVELLHVATLVHDDVVDEASKRRGFPSINQVWKNKVAVLMGDFILSKALSNMIGIKDFEALELISSTAEKLSAGEILQLEKNITKSMTEPIYYEVIKQKTASLISASCELGAITTSKTREDRKAMAIYGESLGMAFQIQDDLFDMLGKESDTGKKSGGDVKRNLRTLPLIHAFSQLGKSDTKQLKKLIKLKKKSKQTMKEIQGFIEVGEGFTYAKSRLQHFSEQALDAIAKYPESSIKQSMIDLLAFNATRVK
ncbi:MAG: polyprenyl synthetase family protein [Candidatus Marinimicrobia bacterium]|nr:polyprenyl synthetase family protein [Candidatus Neomarinimicrobiota bacterium]